jgi:fumarate reductase subunit D
MVRRQAEPLLWLLFSAGGVASAMLMPILLALFGVAFPLGWLTAPSHEHLSAILGNPLARLVLLAVFVLSLFHWAHRFRHTLYDGLQIKHLNEIIALVSYGVAVMGSATAAYMLWRLP